MKNKKQPTKWNLHLDAVRKQNPKLSLKEAMVLASKSYTKK